MEGRFTALLDREILTPAELRAAEATSIARGRELEEVLITEFGVSKRILLQALSEYYSRPSIEYDERMPIPPELLTGLDAERLSMGRWFPVIKDGDTVVIAANVPDDPLVIEEAKKYIHAQRYEIWVALEEDIQWFIQDFLHAMPGRLIGTERTGLAYWRNTMAHWRTRLACYRNDLAKGRTDLALLRWGLGCIALADTLMRTHKIASAYYFYWTMLAAGFIFGITGISGYLKVRRHRMSPPRHQTLVEVTASTLHFLEHYHFIEDTGVEQTTKGTMLARLGDFLASYSTILYPPPASKERTHLARERNVLAGQRTVAACYRTIYARARTGLAFIRTGVAFLSLGLGLVQYFGISVMTALDLLLIVAGMAMIADGALWYFPVRNEQAELPRCPVAW
jgi:uncharacterized membrane protein YidH (DUF202 family)